MAATDFVKEFALFTVGYIYPDYVYSSYDFGEIPLKEMNTVKLAKGIVKSYMKWSINSTKITCSSLPHKQTNVLI